MFGRKQRKELYDYIFWVLKTSWRCLFLFSGKHSGGQLESLRDKILAKDSGTLLLHGHSTKGEEQTATFILGEQAADMLVAWIDGMGYVTTQIRNRHLTFGVCVCVYLRAVIRDT
ncbi:hypothetical protein QR685DRAFT_575655 [Neurospora intermedia]|uniref:Uncharacterized protein n=1 Tax=Neurospora intermedia TaxID=5142 RepID=A0ABR3D015_NEUIN